MITLETACTKINDVLKNAFITESDDKVLFSFYGPGSKSDNDGHLI